MDTNLIIFIIVFFGIIAACAANARNSTLQLKGPRQAPLAPISEQVRSQAQALVDQGKKIEAIKAVRDATGLGLKEAKDIVDALSSGQLPTAMLVPIDQYQPSEKLLHYVRTGNKICALKQLRDETGISLKEAKDHVDAWFANPWSLSASSGDRPAVNNTGVSDKVLALLRSGNKIEALKQLRDETGLSLKEAKDRLDAIR